MMEQSYLVKYEEHLYLVFRHEGKAYLLQVIGYGNACLHGLLILFPMQKPEGWTEADSFMGEEMAGLLMKLPMKHKEEEALPIAPVSSQTNQNAATRIKRLFLI